MIRQDKACDLLKGISNTRTVVQSAHLSSPCFIQEGSACTGYKTHMEKIIYIEIACSSSPALKPAPAEDGEIPSQKFSGKEKYSDLSAGS